MAAPPPGAAPGASPSPVLAGLGSWQSVLNDPNEAGGMMDALTDVYSYFTEPTAGVPQLAPGVLPEVSAAHFERYLRSLAGTYPAFVAAREARRAQETPRACGAEDQPGARAWALVLPLSRSLVGSRFLQNPVSAAHAPPSGLTGGRGQPGSAVQTTGDSLLQVRAAARRASAAALPRSSPQWPRSLLRRR
jgi:hypothetical protein